MLKPDQTSCTAVSNLVPTFFSKEAEGEVGGWRHDLMITSGSAQSKMCAQIDTVRPFIRLFPEISALFRF